MNRFLFALLCFVLPVGCYPGGGHGQDGWDTEGDLVEPEHDVVAEEPDIQHDIPTDSPVCGNGIVEAGEVCDDGDTDDCTGTCNAVCGGLAATCGDGVAACGEECDGNDLSGLSCADFGFSEGELACSSTCGYDLAGCGCEDGIPTYGAPACLNGSPVGGGVGCRDIAGPDDADDVVTTAAELKSALAAASSGDVVYVADGATLTYNVADQTDWYSSDYMIWVKTGVTLAGGRGRAGVTAGTIKCEDPEPIYHGGFQSAVGCDADATVCGLNIFGPSEDKLVVNAKTGVNATSGAEVYNNEIHGWGYAGVSCRSSSTYAKQVWIHHNYIHHNQYLTHVGYGIQPAPGSWVLAEGNIIEYSRHHLMISGGLPAANVEFRYNLLGYADYTQLDSHGDNDDPPTPPAGDLIKIHHNTSTFTEEPFYQCRGIPLTMCSVYNNWYCGAEDFGADGAIHQHMYNMADYGYTAPNDGPFVNMEAYDNWFGTGPPP
jgi:hypothetical protein